MEIRPGDIHEAEFRISQLPQQIIGKSQLSAGADEKIRILANRIRYGEEKPAGQVPVITAWNKKERFFQQAGRSADRYLVFLGDQKEDLYWREENAESFLLREKSA